MYSFLRPFIRHVAAMLIRHSGIGFLLRHTYARNKTTVLLYHDPAPESFERHLRYLSKRFNLIPLGTLVEALQSRDWSQIPPRSLVLTFDDGHAGNYRLLSLFQKYRVRPVIYLVSSVVGTRRHFWFRESVDDVETLKRQSADCREAMLRQSTGYEPTREYADDSRHTLSMDELRALAPHVDFGAHTRFHPVLTTCSDQRCRREIGDSRKEVEQATGTKCLHFSYPNGDYLSRELHFAAQSGYASARTVDVGWNDADTDPLRLRAHYVGDDASLNLLAAQLTGIPTYLRYRLQGGRGGRQPVIAGPDSPRAACAVSNLPGQDATSGDHDWLADKPTPAIAEIREEAKA